MGGRGGGELGILKSEILALDFSPLLYVTLMSFAPSDIIYDYLLNG